MLDSPLRPAAAALAAVILAAGCSRNAPPESAAPAGTAAAPVLSSPEAHDVHSYAQPAVARVTNIDLDLRADFATKTFSGTAALDVDTARNASEIVLDTRGLAIESVSADDRRALQWRLGDTDAILGTPLIVQLDGARRIVVHYASSPDAPALQWLAPEQTAGKRKPYLFSQGEAILTRSWVPTQDSPGIRQTWSARITAPTDLRVVMSAESLTPEGEPAGEGMRSWRFRMEKPVAPYLIAIGIGDLAFRSLGARTGVYTEPSELDRTANEFVDLEKMVDAAESLYGPYRWGRYDLLVLPPSFPFGGMENPRLTFATPTAIAGDRSLVSLVAHELAHSWSGNLVSNATWADFWLNEGFTTYFENRIMERLYGTDVAAMLADLGWDDLQEAIKLAGGPTAPDTRLHLDLTGRDPDDGMSEIAYEKGATFLRTIESVVGREAWDTYLRSYFDRHAFQPQTTAGFLADLRANLLKNDAALESRIGLDQWAYAVGLPDNAVHVHSDALAKIDAEARTFAAEKSAKRATADLDPSKWTTQERVRFLNDLPRKLSGAKLAELDRLLKLSKQGNSEVRFAWLRLAVANRYEPALPSLEEFLTSMGRRKFVAPLFTDLMAQGSWGEPIARRIYTKARPGYHAVTTRTVDKIVPMG